MNRLHAHYRYELLNGVVLVYDLFSQINPVMSVTNDVEFVVYCLNKDIENLDSMKIIYRDTNYDWDEIVIKNNEFYEFKPLNAKDLKQALINLLSTE